MTIFRNLTALAALMLFWRPNSGPRASLSVTSCGPGWSESADVFEGDKLEDFKATSSAFFATSAGRAAICSLPT